MNIRRIMGLLSLALALGAAAAIYANGGGGGGGGGGHGGGHGGGGEGMTEEYIAFYGISANDKNKDLDGDGLKCIEENALWTDPEAADTDRDGLNDLTESSNAVFAISRAWTPLGEGLFVYNEHEMVYARPDWALLVVKDEQSEWHTNTAGRTSWRVPASASNDVGLLQFEIDREIITNDLRIALTFKDASGELLIDLVDTNGVVLVTNLFGSLTAGSGQEKTTTLSLPLAVVPDAAVIQLRRGSGAGEITVYESSLYVDLDGDGLDDKGEKMYGTSDMDADSDDDGLTDGEEVLTYKTDPKNPDSDGDGMKDGVEAKYGLDPLKNDANKDKDGDGMSNFEEIQQGRDPSVGASTDTSGAVGLKVWTPME